MRSRFGTDHHEPVRDAVAPPVMVMAVRGAWSGLRASRRRSVTALPTPVEYPLTWSFESGCRDLNPGPLDPQVSNCERCADLR
jgi:hypothetical protein